MDKVQILVDSYPLEDLLEQNDIEVVTVIQWLVDEGKIDLEDYFFDEEEIDD